MPNHIYNSIKITAPEKDIGSIRQAIQHDRLGPGTIDFEKIIPMPDYIFRGNLGPAEREAYGADNWYDWSIEHWDTKWNAYGFQDFPEPDDNEIVFNTAWSAPTPILQKLSQMYPDALFEHSWADEDIGANLGIAEYKGGKVLDLNCPKQYSREAYELYQQITGYDLAEIGYALNKETGTYEYHEPAFDMEGGMN